MARAVKWKPEDGEEMLWVCPSCDAELNSDCVGDLPVQPVEGGGDGWGRVRAAIADAIIWRDATAGDWDDVNAGYLDTIFAAYSAAGGNTTSDPRSQLAKQSEDMADIRRAVLEEAIGCVKHWFFANNKNAQGCIADIRSLIDPKSGEG